MIQDVIEYYTY